MADSVDLGNVKPDHVFDGGDMDCGSGLVLLIRENMLQVPVGGILELRSREPSVGDDLPPWCRLSGHEYVGALPGADRVRYFVRRGAAARADQKELQSDKEKAKEYEWRARVRATGSNQETVYCRNFSFQVGQPASFEEKDLHPSAVEYLLGALGADLCAGLSIECSREGVLVDDLELTIRGKLHNVLAHLGLEEGDPSFRSIDVRCFASTTEDEAKLRPLWDRAMDRSPLLRTLIKVVEVNTRFSLV